MGILSTLDKSHNLSKNLKYSNAFNFKNSFYLDYENLDPRIAKKLLYLGDILDIEFENMELKNSILKKSKEKKYTINNIEIINRFYKNKISEKEIELFNFLYENFNNVLYFDKNLEFSISTIALYGQLNNKKILFIANEKIPNLFWIIKKIKKNFLTDNLENDLLNDEKNDILKNVWDRYSFKFTNNVYFLIFKNYENIVRNICNIIYFSNKFDFIVPVNFYEISFIKNDEIKKQKIEHQEKNPTNHKDEIFNDDLFQKKYSKLFFLNILNQKLILSIVQLQKNIIFIETEFYEEHGPLYFYYLKYFSNFYFNYPILLSSFEKKENFLKNIKNNKILEFFSLKNNICS